MKQQEEDKVRFDAEVKQMNELGYFVNSKGQKSTDIMRQQPKFRDFVVMPKKVGVAYMIFLKQNYAAAAEKCEGKKTAADVSRIVTEMWRVMTDDEK